MTITLRRIFPGLFAVLVLLSCIHQLSAAIMLFSPTFTTGWRDYTGGWGQTGVFAVFEFTPGGPSPTRGATEFDISALYSLPIQSINSASLTLPKRPIISTPSILVGVRSYAGNGTKEALDVTTSGDSFFSYTDVLATNPQTVSVTTALNNRFGATDNFVGFQFRGPEQGGVTQGRSWYPPTLTIDYTPVTPTIPEPSSLAIWAMLGLVGASVVRRRKRLKGHTQAGGCLSGDRRHC